MSSYNFVELSESGTTDSRLLDTGEVRVTATRAFIAYAINVTELANIQEIVNASDLPQIGEMHPNFNGLRATQRTLVRDSEPMSICHKAQTMVVIKMHKSKKVVKRLHSSWTSIALKAIDL